MMGRFLDQALEAVGDKPFRQIDFIVFHKFIQQSAFKLIFNVPLFGREKVFADFFFEFGKRLTFAGFFGEIIIKFRKLLGFDFFDLDLKNRFFAGVLLAGKILRECDADFFFFAGLETNKLRRETFQEFFFAKLKSVILPFFDFLALDRTDIIAD